MATSNITFVIVPGGWHLSSCYESLKSKIESAGFDVVIASLPSLNSTTPFEATCILDAEAIRDQTLLPLIEKEGKSIVLVNHSYGGIPGCGAAKGLSVVARAKAGLHGGIIGIVHMSAFLVPSGVSLVVFLGGSHPPYISQDKPTPGLCEVDNPIPVFFNDVKHEDALVLEKALLPHAKLAFESEAPSPAWQEPEFEGRLAFLRCTEDKALPLFVQDMFMDRSGVKWVVKDIEASHSAFASRPEEVTEFLLDWADKCNSKVM